MQDAIVLDAYSVTLFATKEAVLKKGNVMFSDRLARLGLVIRSSSSPEL